MDRNVPLIDQFREKKFLAILKMINVVLGVVVLSVLFFQFWNHDDWQYTVMDSIIDSLSNVYKTEQNYSEKSHEAKELLRYLEEIEEATNRLKILKNYGYEKAGRFDLALYDAGGRIVSIGNTQPFHECSFLWKLIGCPIQFQGPENLIKRWMHQGSCFRFKGKKASIIIRLITPAILDYVTIEHITKKMSLSNEVTSAPRNFTISGLNYKEDKPFPFGFFQFNANQTSLQTYIFTQRASIAHRYVKVDFHDNNGHPSETCVYRVRIHGVVEGMK